MNLDLTALTGSYRSGEAKPSEVFAALAGEIAAADPAIWTTAPDAAALLARARELDAIDPASLPLYGVPFAVKDNIDVAGVPTTAGCPAFGYTPQRSAAVVQRLVDAGAVPVGKTNLDQFATGLVGVRSPYGVPANAFDPDFIPGGSSSGSAVAVAKGLCTFALGTDTAGSGRVPAAFNNLVGIKPSCGLLSTRGVVPACRTLDCVTVFAAGVATGSAVLELAAGYDDADPFSRRPPADRSLPDRPVVAVPQDDQLEFFGGTEYPALWEAAARRLGEAAEVRVADFTPFFEAARLLYGGPWVAERYAAIRGFLEANPEDLHPTTLAIIRGGKEPLAFEAFEATYRLAELKRATQSVFESGIDLIATPTAGRIYTRAEVEQDPVRLNTNLGYYTNFMNLLDLCAVAVPAGFGAFSGLPFGITVAAPAFTDRALARFAAGFAGSARAGPPPLL